MIEDFGEKIDGAAKDRWRTYLKRFDTVGDREIFRLPLSQSFPEPPYDKLLEEGGDVWKISVLRALRDEIPRRPAPRKPNRVHVAWGADLVARRGLARAILQGEFYAEELRRVLADTGINGNRAAGERVLMRADAYMRLSPSISLKDVTIEQIYCSRVGQETFDPARLFYRIRNEKAKLNILSPNRSDAINRLVEGMRHTEPENTRRKAGNQFRIVYFQNDDRPWIVRKLGKHHIRIKSFDTPNAARVFLFEKLNEVQRLYKQIIDAPVERREGNEERNGPSYRNGRNVTPQQFSRTFGFRGVQFGNYVEGDRRQSDLNRAYDALQDLALVLGCEPRALSLDGKLGLAFGARGKGGRNAAAAHYEPDELVINLTKANGAGTLAHEWFHALDNIIGHAYGSKTYFATSVRLEASQRLPEVLRPIARRLAEAGQSLIASPMFERSRYRDSFRSSPYFSLPYETSARAFEAWVVHRLEQKDMRNDYLANIQSEAVFDAEAKLLGLRMSRYPYPRKSEMPGIAKIFDTCFAADGPLVAILGEMGRREVDAAHKQPSARPARELAGDTTPATQMSLF